MVFFNSCNIRDKVYIVVGGQEGDGVGVGGGWEAEGSNTIHKGANSSAMSSVGHRNCHSQPDRTRRLSAAA